MSPFLFQPFPTPFPQWMGPFSPARGKYTGFRISSGQVGTWVENQAGREFWPFVDSPGSHALSQLVREHWGGGRILMLPNGHIIKPLQHDAEVGQRVLIGRFTGAVQLQRPHGGIFDMSAPGRLEAGDEWPGPKTTGIECMIQSDGSLQGKWYHPTDWGRDGVSEILCPPDGSLANGFSIGRQGDTVGRVRITANGHVITNRQEWNGVWVSIYVGQIIRNGWKHRPEWIR